jgi:farnesyl diphosphate synthase
MLIEVSMQEARATVGAEIARAIGAAKGDLADAMRHALYGGKCLRGFLVIESARLHGIDPVDAAPAAAGIEALHAYSLVHDDLPCMDDDDLRRGQPTVHRKWDEATAVLAGDALHTLAFGLVARTLCPDSAKVALIASLADAAGLHGMVGGQALDIAAEAAAVPLTLEQIVTLQSGKTGALLTWSSTAGARMANADTAALKAYGDALGLAFQIADDILDVEGDEKQVGKALRKDTAARKATFVSLLGLETAKLRAASLISEACDALSPYGSEAETLRAAARFVIARRN